MLRNLLFDLDDTIFDFHRAEQVALTATLEAMGIEPTEAVMSRYSVLNLQQWKLLEKGMLTRAEVKVRRYRLLFEELGLPDRSEEAARLYEQRLGRGHWFIEGAEALLGRLYGRYRLYLVTNGTASVQNGRLDSSGIRGLFDGIFISEELGRNKPDPAYYEACFARIPDFRREESIAIGDSLTSDIKGGRDAGLRTIWFCPEGKEPRDTEGILPDYRIRSLSELEPLLQTL